MSHVAREIRNCSINKITCSSFTKCSWSWVWEKKWSKSGWHSCVVMVPIQCVSSRPWSSPLLVFGQHILQYLLIILLVLYFPALLLLSRAGIEAIQVSAFSHDHPLVYTVSLHSAFLYLQKMQSPSYSKGINLPLSSQCPWLYFLGLALEILSLSVSLKFINIL